MQTKRTLGLSTLILAVFILFSSFVYGNTNWYNWGNVGSNYGGSFADYLLFGSNFPQGNNNFTSKTILVGSDYTPIVADLNNQGQNYMYFFDGAVLYQYDNNGDIVTSISVNGTFCGGSVVMNNGNNGDSEIYSIIDSAGTPYYINRFTQNSNGVLILDEVVELCDSCTVACHLNGDISAPINDKIYTVIKTAGSFGKLYEIDISDLSSSVIGSAQTWDFADYTTSTIPAGYSSLMDYDKDGNTEIVWIGSGGGATDDCVLYEYEIETNTYRNLILSTSYCQDASVGFSNIGSQGSVSEMVIHLSNADYHKIVDSSMTEVFSVQCLQDNTAIAVADINLDGNNEYCYVCDTTFKCYDGTYTQIMQYNISTADYNDFGMIALGEYENTTNNYLEVLVQGGMFILNDTSANLSEITDLGTDGYSGMYIPVSIQNQASYTKDILYVDTSRAIYKIASGEIAVCGNGECESGETIFSCFADCGTGNATTVNQTQGNFGYMQECSQDSDCYGSSTCSAGYCTGLVEGSSCDYDFQCQSKDCNEFGFCSKEDRVDTFKNFFILTGFNSTGSQLFLALVMIFVGTIGGASIGLGAGLIGAVIGSIAGLILSMMFTILVLGWIGVWILFIIIMISIIAVVITIFLKGS